MYQIGVQIEICLGNSHGNFQLHRLTKSENIAKCFRGAATFLTHTIHELQTLKGSVCPPSICTSLQVNVTLIFLFYFFAS